MPDETIPNDDKLATPEVGAWAEEKHRMVSLYATLFSSGMKDKWSKRVYVELYAGAGYSRIRGTSKYIFGSPLLALKVRDPFDKYVFCEAKPKNLQALRNRASQISSSRDVAYVEGDCNMRIPEILAEIPRGSAGDTVLTLCFADPFDIGLEFETIRTLAKARYIDFLVLLALGMDANRNYEHYLREDSDKVDRFLGSGSWRKRWAAAQWDAIKFTRFLSDEFTKSMATLGYIPPAHYTMKKSDRPRKIFPCTVLHCSRATSEHISFGIKF